MSDKIFYADYVLAKNSYYLFSFLSTPIKEGFWGAVAFLPSPAGKRFVQGRRYQKAQVLKSLALGVNVYPNQENIRCCNPYGTKLVFLKEDDLTRIMRAKDTLRTLIEINQKNTNLRMRNIPELIKILSDESNVDVSNMGLTGSDLIGLAMPDSDIDLVIYGAQNAIQVQKAVSNLRHNGIISPISLKDSWHMQSQFSDFFNVRGRSYPAELIQRGLIDFKGVFNRTKFDLYFVEFQREYEKIEEWENIGLCLIEAIVEDDTDIILTPSIFLLRVLKYPKDRVLPLRTEVEVISLLNCTRMLRKGDRVKIWGNVRLVRSASQECLQMILIDNNVHKVTIIEFGG